jgi:hypothetical protein
MHYSCVLNKTGGMKLTINKFNLTIALSGICNYYCPVKPFYFMKKEVAKLPEVSLVYFQPKVALSLFCN